MKYASAQQVLCTTRRSRRAGGPELRFRVYLYQGLHTDPDTGTTKSCGDGICFHRKRSADVRCAVHTAPRGE